MTCNVARRPEQLPSRRELNRVGPRSGLAARGNILGQFNSRLLPLCAQISGRPRMHWLGVLPSRRRVARRKHHTQTLHPKGGRCLCAIVLSADRKHNRERSVRALRHRHSTRALPSGGDQPPFQRAARPGRVPCRWRFARVAIEWQQASHWASADLAGRPVAGNPTISNDELPCRSGNKHAQPLPR